MELQVTLPNPPRLRLVVQRIKNLRLSANGLGQRGELSHGLLVYVGFGFAFDGSASGGSGLKQPMDATSLKTAARKVINLRTFSQSSGKVGDFSTQETTNSEPMNLAVKDVAGGIAIVSQFTLWADCRKGNRPGFQNALDPESARHSFDDLVKAFKTEAQCQSSNPIEIITGVFGSDMQIEYTNDGPVTFVFDICQGRVLAV